MNNRKRAISLLFVLGSVLVMLAGWNMPQAAPPQIAR
jgi:hypothetical protein